MIMIIYIIIYIIMIMIIYMIIYFTYIYIYIHRARAPEKRHPWFRDEGLGYDGVEF